jgi:hypothetical protein
MPTASDAFLAARLRLPQPWSRRLGQLAYLPKLVRGDEPTRLTFAEERVIEPLAMDDAPLAGVGAGMSERVIEVPWVIRTLRRSERLHVLDVGTAFAPVVYKRLLQHLPHEIEAVDLANRRVPGVKTHVADVRNLPFGNESFDVALCISTLEHIGMDNEHYGVQGGGGGGDVVALRELGRVAARVLVTVPAGDDEDLGGWRLYAPSTFRERLAQAGLSVARLEVFRHDRDGGWRQASEDAVAGCRFGEVTYSAAAVICAEVMSSFADPFATPS